MQIGKWQHCTYFLLKYKISDLVILLSNGLLDSVIYFLQAPPLGFSVTQSKGVGLLLLPLGPEDTAVLCLFCSSRITGILKGGAMQQQSC